MAGSIICGVDDSQSAKGAARVARALAGELGSSSSSSAFWRSTRLKRR